MEVTLLIVGHRHNTSSSSRDRISTSAATVETAARLRSEWLLFNNDEGSRSGDSYKGLQQPNNASDNKDSDVNTTLPASGAAAILRTVRGRLELCINELIHENVYTTSIHLVTAVNSDSDDYGDIKTIVSNTCEIKLQVRR